MASRVPDASREPVLPRKRRKLTRVEFARLMLDQEGRCARCGLRLIPEAIIDEHLTALDHGGTNDLSNRALYCLDCARDKTASDFAATLHGRRIRGEAGQTYRRKRRAQGDWVRPSFATNRDGPWKKRMDGSVVRRRPRRSNRTSEI
jgi:5-methylcytosine-specific restriction endonuclease McrA